MRSFKEVFVIRFGQEYYGVANKQIGLFKLHSPHVSKFSLYASAENALDNWPLPPHMKGEFFQIVKYYVNEKPEQTIIGEIA